MKTNEVIKLLKNELKIWKQQLANTEQFNKEFYNNYAPKKAKYRLNKERQVIIDFEEAIKILQQTDINH